MNQRVTKSEGGVGLVKNAMRLRHKCRACQWMRTITIRVSKG